jgi:hypothetical protein
MQDILENFEFRNQVPRLSKADALATLIEKFLSPDINLSPDPVYNGDGSMKHSGLDNHAMGTIFEELVRRFNEENNEEAREHWTPRDAVKLMAMPFYADTLAPWRTLAAAMPALGFMVFLFWHLNLHYMNILFAVLG